MQQFRPSANVFARAVLITGCPKAYPDYPDVSAGTDHRGNSRRGAGLAEAGTHLKNLFQRQKWIPACAGMTPRNSASRMQTSQRKHRGNQQAY
jgi:hypothetical protein